MEEQATTETPTADPLNDRDAALYAGAFERIVRWMCVLLPLTAAAGWYFLQRAFALGLLGGGALALLNFYSLRRLVHSFADRVIGTTEARGGGRIVFRFLLRYALFAVAGYVIFRGSAVSAYGIFAGLALPVPAIFAEAVYEFVVALKRGE